MSTGRKFRCRGCDRVIYDEGEALRAQAVWHRCPKRRYKLTVAKPVEA